VPSSLGIKAWLFKPATIAELSDALEILSPVAKRAQR